MRSCARRPRSRARAQARAERAALQTPPQRATSLQLYSAVNAQAAVARAQARAPRPRRPAVGSIGMCGKWAWQGARAGLFPVQLAAHVPVRAARPRRWRAWRGCASAWRPWAWPAARTTGTRRGCRRGWALCRRSLPAGAPDNGASPCAAPLQRMRGPASGNALALQLPKLGRASLACHPCSARRLRAQACARLALDAQEPRHSAAPGVAGSARSGGAR